jgi:ankyrin repeat protein
MHVAASMGHLEVVKLLLDTGTGIHASNYVRLRLDMRSLLAYWNAKRYANAVLFILIVICPSRFTEM